MNLKISSYRHIAIAFMEKHILHFSKEAVNIENLLAGEMDSTMNDASVGVTGPNLLFNEQAGHNTNVANSFYAFSTDDFTFMSKDNLQNYYLCSLEWHSLLRKFLSEICYRTLHLLCLGRFTNIRSTNSVTTCSTH